MGIPQPPKAFLGVPALPCSSQGAAGWVALGMIQCTVKCFTLRLSPYMAQDIPDQPPDCFFETFSCAIWHQDIPNQPPNLFFEAFSCSSWLRTSLITPQISLPAWEPCVKIFGSTDTSLLQKGNQPALLMVVRTPKNLLIEVLWVPTSYHTW